MKVRSRLMASTLQWPHSDVTVTCYFSVWPSITGPGCSSQFRGRKHIPTCRSDVSDLVGWGMWRYEHMWWKRFVKGHIWLWWICNINTDFIQIPVRGSNRGGGRNFPHQYRPDLGPIQPPIKRVPDLFPAGRRPERDVDRPPHLATRWKKEYCYTSTPLGAFMVC